MSVVPFLYLMESTEDAGMINIGPSKLSARLYLISAGYISMTFASIIAPSFRIIMSWALTLKNHPESAKTTAKMTFFFKIPSKKPV
jgi:hypothetical protein